MKIECPVCDLHPAYPLAPAEIRLRLGFSENVIGTLRCTRPMCDRHYTKDYGYFANQIGQPFDYGNLSAKLNCGHRHDPVYMIVARVDGEVLWACPEPQCDRAEPFKTDD
jgi:hypothetical protein